MEEPEFIKSLQDKLLKAYEEVKAIKDKDIVLVIGNSGAGKSTTIAYLMGAKFEPEVVLNTKRAKLTEGSVGKLPGTSDDFDSMTFYPKAYLAEDKSFYCDCPGFEESRGEVEKICVPINIQMAVKFSKSISSIMIVIDKGSIIADKGAGLKNLIKTLRQILKNPTDIQESFLFLITGAEGSRFDDLLKLIVKLEEYSWKNRGNSESLC